MKTLNLFGKDGVDAFRGKIRGAFFYLMMQVFNHLADNRKIPFY
ncbi:MAG TPA: hypothetical protein VIJ27_06865 [Mucilaginibacter sp.]